MAQLTLELPTAFIEQARRHADEIDQPVEQFLAGELLGRPLGAEPVDLSALTDEQLMVHITAMVPEPMQERISDLAWLANDGKLTDAEKDEYDRLLLQAHTASMLKAHALLAWKRRHGTLPPPFTSTK